MVTTPPTRHARAPQAPIPTRGAVLTTSDPYRLGGTRPGTSKNVPGPAADQALGVPRPGIRAQSPRAPRPPANGGGSGSPGVGRGGAGDGAGRSGRGKRAASKVAVAATMVAVMALASTMTGMSAVRADICRTASVEDAFARGEATALIIKQSLISLQLPSPTTSSSQYGPGQTVTTDSGPVFLYPADGSIATVATMQVKADSKVAADNIRADQVSTAELARVDLMDGLVTVDLVTANARATATDQMADVSGAGSTLVSARVNGVAYPNVYPNLKVPLPSQFGAGSYVTLYERKDFGQFPDKTHPNYVADSTIRMVHLFVRDSDPTLPGDQSVEIIAGEAHAHAEAPTAWCGGLQWVGANAVVARVQPDAMTSPIVVGEVRIPDTGGESTQAGLELMIDDKGSLIRGTAAASKATGRIYPGSWDVSYAMAEITNLCIGPKDGPDAGKCDVSAELVRAESNSVAAWNKADSWGTSKIAHLEVLGVDVCATLGLQDTCAPPPNTKLVIGSYTVYLNERTYDGKASSCLGHTGQTSTAVRIVGPTVGTIILAKAYSTATFC